jgi:uncharacterized membrane protein YadS
VVDWVRLLLARASVCNTYLSAGGPVYSVVSHAARVGLTATLYLIGTGISVATLKRVGHRPMLLGVILWLIISTVSLWLIREGWIAL